MQYITYYTRMALTVIATAMLVLVLSPEIYAQDTIKLSQGGIELGNSTIQKISVADGAGQHLQVKSGAGVNGGHFQLFGGDASNGTGGSIALIPGRGLTPGVITFQPDWVWNGEISSTSFRFGGSFQETPNATLDIMTIGSQSNTFRARASDGTEIMQLKNNGLLGLGMAPLATLDIRSTFENGAPLRVTSWAGPELLRFLDDGRMGFGTNSPTYKMHIAGGDLALDRIDTETSGVIRQIHLVGAQNTSQNRFAEITFKNYDSGDDWEYPGARISSHNASSSGSADLRFATKDTDDPLLMNRMEITPNGRVVIGDQTAGATLDVKTVEGGSVNMRARSNLGVDLFKVMNSGRLNAYGQVVIGNQTPTATLDIKTVDGTTVNLRAKSSLGANLLKLSDSGRLDVYGDMYLKGPASLPKAGQEYVAVFQNTDPTSEGSDGIAIQIGTNGGGNGDYHTNGTNDYITFVNGKAQATGSIEGFDILLDNPFSAFPAEPFTNFFDIFDFESAFTLPSATWSNLVTFTEPTLTIDFLEFVFDFDPGGISFDGTAFDPGGFDASAFFNPSAATGAAAAVANVVCWGLSNDMESLITTNPFDLILASTIITQTNLCKENGSKGGVTFVSFGADYAEWLLRENPEEEIRNGQIVGVKNGKISKNTEHADQILAISTNPIVLGNKPVEGQESHYEKVGFMGQVPVLVAGKVREGDYIIPSGRNDGMGIAIAADQLKIEDVPVILGRAWSNSNNDVLDYINVAVGLNRNDIATLVMKEQKEVQQQLTSLSERLSSLEQNVGQPAH